jgi:CD164 antigen
MHFFLFVAPASSTAASPTTTAGGEGTTGNPDPTTGDLTTPSPAACDDGQSFDAASFIGGIVLAIGVMGIVFLGCKFFRAKSEQSYHQF